MKNTLEISPVADPFRKMIPPFHPHLLLKDAEPSAKPNRNGSREKTVAAGPPKLAAPGFPVVPIFCAQWGLNE